MACSPMACLHQKPQQASNNKTILSIIRHDDDPMIMKPPPPSLITTTRRRVLFPPRLSIKAAASSSSPVIVNKKQISAAASPPWLMPTPEIELSSGTDTVFIFYSLAEDKVITIDRKNLKDHLGLESARFKCKGSSHGWLVLLERHSSDLFLYNPLSNRHLKLPSIRSLEVTQKQDSWLADSTVKVIISSSDPEGDVDCRALMIHGRQGNMSFCCPSTSDEWIETYRRYDDVVCAGDNLFFGVDDSHWPYPEFEGWDLKDVSRPMLISLEDSIVKDYGETFPWKGFDFDKEWPQANFLVAADDGRRRQLFYVCLRCGEDYDLRDLKNVHFHVHKFDFENAKLVHMDRSLDGLAFFVGRNHSFAIMPAGDDGVKPDSIYFTHTEEDIGMDIPPLLGRHHMKIYDYAQGSFSTTPFYVAYPDWKICDFADPPMWYTPTTATSSST